jgi:hypothetical protein
MATDILGRELAVGDFVVVENGLYEIVDIPDLRKMYNDLGQSLPNLPNRVIIRSVIKSKITRSYVTMANNLCRVPSEDVMVWLLKKDTK